MLTRHKITASERGDAAVTRCLSCLKADILCTMSALQNFAVVECADFDDDRPWQQRIIHVYDSVVQAEQEATVTGRYTKQVYCLPVQNGHCEFITLEGVKCYGVDTCDTPS